MYNRLPKQHYRNAPITEAVIDLRVEVPADLGLKNLREVLAEDAEMERYPSKEALLLEGVQFARSGDGASTTSTVRQEIGVRFHSTDGKYVFQARRDGFTLSRLSPYENWASFRTEARRLWNLYRATARPTRVLRAALRYINRINIPLPLNDFSEYFRTFPEVSRDLPQALSGYFMQLKMPLEHAECVAIINQAVLENSTSHEPVPENIVAILLDIDLFRTANLPSEDDGIWVLLDALAEEKNQVFEASITDKTRKLFQ